jgi:hypothetical protein
LADFLVAWTWVVLGAMGFSVLAGWLGMRWLSVVLLLYPLVLSGAVRLFGGEK